MYLPVVGPVPGSHIAASPSTSLASLGSQYWSIPRPRFLFSTPYLLAGPCFFVCPSKRQPMPPLLARTHSSHVSWCMRRQQASCKLKLLVVGPALRLHTTVDQNAYGGGGGGDLLYPSPCRMYCTTGLRFLVSIMDSLRLALRSKQLVRMR